MEIKSSEQGPKLGKDVGRQAGKGESNIFHSESFHATSTIHENTKQWPTSNQSWTIQHSNLMCKYDVPFLDHFSNCFIYTECKQVVKTKPTLNMD